MANILPKKRGQRILLIAVASLVLLGGGAVAAKWIVWPKIKTWRETRAVSTARDLFNRDDLPNAILATRKALSYNQNNTEAWRLGVDITEKQNSPHAYYYQQNLARISPTLENELKLARIAKKHGFYPQAFEVISKIGANNPKVAAEASKSPEFFTLAAEVSQRLGNITKAKFYLISLINLTPNDNKARLELANIRLSEGFEENKPSVRAELRTIANDPALRANALGLLLADALSNKNEKNALELADQLAACSDAGTSGHILIAQVYNLYATKRLAPYLDKLKQTYATTPDSVVKLTNYLVSLQRITEALRWIDSLDDTVKKNESVQLTYAQALIQNKDLAAAALYLGNCKWQENEYLRQVLLAFLARQNGDDRTFTECWRLALIEVGTNATKLGATYGLVSRWGWTEQKMDLIWKKYLQDPADKNSKTQITNWERSRGNTRALSRLYSRAMEFDPADREAKNNFAYTSLLLNTATDQAQSIAISNAAAEPKNAFYATTLALALYRQGKAQEALQTLEKIGSAELSVRERTLLHSVLLVANDKIEEGADLASFLKKDQFLPEERAMLNESATIIAKARREQNTTARIAALNTQADNPNRKSWVNTLPAAFRSKSVQMALADTLYATDDFKGLVTTLKSEQWEENDFLRLALLSYAQRNLGQNSEANSTWKYTLVSAGSRTANLSALEDMCERWSWIPERTDLLAKLYQRDPADITLMNELAEHYSKNGLSAELANLYDKHLDATPNDADTKARFAYYSIITGTNLSRAHLLIKESYDNAPDDTYRAKVYALSLSKQSRPDDASAILEKIPTTIGERGHAQLALIKATIALQNGKTDLAANLLKSFDPATALPEEIAAADSLTKTINQKQ